MKPYIAIVHQEGDSAYGVTFPDAPGCFSAADEIDDLFAMATEALELWTEAMIEGGMAIPPTRDLSEIKADPEWTESFADAVLVIALPPRPESAKFQTVDDVEAVGEHESGLRRTQKENEAIGDASIANALNAWQE